MVASVNFSSPPLISPFLVLDMVFSLLNPGLC